MSWFYRFFLFAVFYKGCAQSGSLLHASRSLNHVRSTCKDNKKHTSALWATSVIWDTPVTLVKVHAETVAPTFLWTLDVGLLIVASGKPFGSSSTSSVVAMCATGGLTTDAHAANGLSYASCLSGPSYFACGCWVLLCVPDVTRI